VENVGIFLLTVGREAEDEINGSEGVDLVSTGCGDTAIASTPTEKVGCCRVRCDSGTVCSGVHSASSHAVKITESMFVSNH
jgi:hypothetical protein